VAEADHSHRMPSWLMLSHRGDFNATIVLCIYIYICLTSKCVVVARPL
jgi:hypothetical protein